MDWWWEEHGRLRARRRLQAMIGFLVMAAVLAGGAVFIAVREHPTPDSPAGEWLSIIASLTWMAVGCAGWQVVWYRHFRGGGRDYATASGAAFVSWGIVGLWVLAFAMAQSWWLLLIHPALLVIMIAHESYNLRPEGKPDGKH
ncbi:hypothetical protein ACFXK0_13075 [Nocardia sp. NPDC059177]|uniref:hypothetical protein n=1 Tax=Nocardia sp. NPDC059177 TaxID=3346759 RepID=UPI0036BC1666